MSNPIITVQDQFIAAFSAVNGTGIYENELKKVYQLSYTDTPEHPSIVIVFGQQQKVNIIDGAMSAENFAMNFGIACFIAYDTDIANTGICRQAQYSLFADILRLIQSINKSYVNSSPSWLINPSVPITMTAVEPFIGNDNTLVFGVNGQILIRNLDLTLS
jgi:hypothetical protein